MILENFQSNPIYLIKEGRIKETKTNFWIKTQERERERKEKKLMKNKRNFVGCT